MQKKIISFMEEYHMVEEGERILAAVSGGADSMCLLLALIDIQAELGFQLCAVHVEHGIRGEESEHDARFVERFCRQHGIPIQTYRCKAQAYAKAHKMTVEEGARKLRYGFFGQAAEQFGADKIAVAHNKNDCAETMLFHLARGSGLRGLCGIPPVRGNIIRPLLCVERWEIESYLAKRGQTYCQDKTNDGLEYTRNRIRHKAIPVLQEVNRQAIPHMAQAAYLLTQAAGLAEELAGQAESRYVEKREDGFFISQDAQKEPPLVTGTMCHKLLAKLAGSGQDISETHIRQLSGLLEKQVGKTLDLPYGMVAERVYGGILLGKSSQKEPGDPAKEGWVLQPEGVLEIPSFGYEIHTRILDGSYKEQLYAKSQENALIPKKMYTEWLDYDKIKGIMHLRTRREKDYFVISADGKRKKLKNYFIDEKVPRKERGSILLLADDVHIVWAVGRRISEDVKITEHTKRILEIQVYGGNIHE